MYWIVLAGALIVYPTISFAADKADRVVVNKSEARLYLERAGKRIASYKVAFGAHPKGHKEREGDERTPEGRYILDRKNSASSYHRSIHLSYPNARDTQWAKEHGFNPGGDIMIHGQRNGLGWLGIVTQLFDWTDGCIALRDGDIDAVWEAVDVGTPIEIYP